MNFPLQKVKTKAILASERLLFSPYNALNHSSYQNVNDLEITTIEDVIYINMNHPDNREFLKRCKPLYDYTMFISKIQTYQKNMSTADAVAKAIDECITEDILAAFLKSHKSEVAHMYLAEVDEQLIIANSYSEGRAEGRAEGRTEGHTEHLSSQIAKKFAKGKSLEQIAEELEEDVETIRPIYEKLVNERK